MAVAPKRDQETAEESPLGAFIDHGDVDWSSERRRDESGAESEGSGGGEVLPICGVMRFGGKEPGSNALEPAADSSSSGSSSTRFRAGGAER